MLFNSFEFIFIFLPITLIIFSIASSTGSRSSFKLILLISSLVFYSYWKLSFAVIFVASILINFYSSKKILNPSTEKRRKTYLIFGITFNVALLVYYKYTMFLLDNINYFFESRLPIPDIVLPLAISFFTFQQIAYLVDCYKERNIKYDLIEYSLFVSFFPQLIAGPIVHHSEIMPQIYKLSSLRLENLVRGLFVFILGLFKKVVIADRCAKIASLGFGSDQVLTFYDSWISSLTYTLQLYFDFSGYSDMAIGLGIIFGLSIPDNFNSPYKAVNIQDFWRRWHMTLSRWLKDYVYIPLGGNQRGFKLTLLNIFLTFLIGGIWHGAGWTFVIWGAMHGVANLVYRLWDNYSKCRMPKWLGIFVTFNFANIAWVFFRASDPEKAVTILRSMFTLQNFILPERLSFLSSKMPFLKFGLHSPVLEVNFKILAVVIATIAACFVLPNSKELRRSFKPNYQYLFLLTIFSLAFLFLNDASEFIYFQF